MVTAMTESGSSRRTSGLEEIMYNGVVMSNIISKLPSAQDWYAASLVCKSWYIEVISQATKLVVQRRASLPHLVKSFKHVVVLDLSRLGNELEDGDLELCAYSFRFLQSLSLGHQESSMNQRKITNVGIFALARGCGRLENVKLVRIAGLEDAGVQEFGVRCCRLRSLVLGSCSRLTDAAVDAICEFLALEELELFGNFPSITAAGLAKIGLGCQKLFKIRLALDDVDIQPVLKALAEGNCELREVCVGGTCKNISSLAKCTSLTSLIVEGRQWDELDRQVLPICKANKNLKELSLTSGSLSSKAVRKICRVLKLEKFHLADGSDLSEADVQRIVRCPTLQHLTLMNYDIELNVECDDYLHDDDGITELKSLVLKGCSINGSETLGLLVFANEDVERLDLSGESSNDYGFFGGQLTIGKRYKHVQVLDLSYTSVATSQLAAIAREAPALKQLSLTKCKEVDMESVAMFTGLETLNVSACKFVTDRSLEFLASSCPRLLELDISYTEISDEGLIHLCRCTLLRSLNVGHCRAIYDEGLLRVAKSCLFFQEIIISEEFQGTEILDELEELCRVSLCPDRTSSDSEEEDE